MKFILMLLPLAIGLAGCSGTTVSSELADPSPTSSVEAEAVESSDHSLSDSLNPSGYSSLCEFGQFDSGWEGLYEWASKTGFCVGPTSWQAAIPDEDLPSSWSVDIRPSDVEPCKILNFDPGPNSQDPTNRAFPLPSQVEQYENFFPKPDGKLLIAGVVGTDSAPAEGTPASDYAADGHFIQQWINGMNDFGDGFEVHFSPVYLDVGGNLKDYGITHSSSREKRQAFADDVLTMLDEALNLDIWDGVIVVTTPGTPRGVIEQAALPWKNKAVMTIPPKTYTTRFVPDFPMIMPMWVIHELGHVGSGLDDPNGSNYFQNRQGGDSADLGMAGWGLQSTSLTDRLGWNKWITGFMRDEQVICADLTEPVRYAIKASSIVTTDEKIIVLPLSDKRVLVLESIRATGLNYKLQPESEGLLVYEINTEDQRREHGAKLFLGSGRQPERDVPLIVPDAPLKAGESIVYEGITIEVLEASDNADWVEITSG